MTKCIDCKMEILTGDDGTHLCAACYAERWKNAQSLVNTIYDLGREEKLGVNNASRTR